MSHATARRHLESSPGASRRSLFKRDHPRSIDRYIDYFGTAAGELTVVDPCGEALLDSFESGRPLAAAFIVEVRS